MRGYVRALIAEENADADVDGKSTWSARNRRQTRNRSPSPPNQGSVHEQHGVLAESPTWLEGEQGAEMVDDAVAGRLRDPDQRSDLAQRQVRAPVGDNQQDAVFQRQTSRSAPPRRLPLAP